MLLVVEFQVSIQVYKAKLGSLLSVVFFIYFGCLSYDLAYPNTIHTNTVFNVWLHTSELADRGIRSLGIARSTEGDSRGWVWLGILTFTDPPRHDTKDTVRSLRLTCPYFAPSALPVH